MLFYYYYFQQKNRNRIIELGGNGGMTVGSIGYAIRKRIKFDADLRAILSCIELSMKFHHIPTYHDKERKVNKI